MENKTIKEVVLEKVYVNDKNKDGIEFKDKNNKKFWKVAIQIQGDQQWYSKLCYKADDRETRLAVGDKVKLALWSTPGAQGTFYNFQIPSGVDLLEIRVKALENLVMRNTGGVASGDVNHPVTAPTQAINGIPTGNSFPVNQMAGNTDVPYPVSGTDDINPEDIPF